MSIFEGLGGLFGGGKAQSSTEANLLIKQGINYNLKRQDKNSFEREFRKAGWEPCSIDFYAGTYNHEEVSPRDRLANARELKRQLGQYVGGNNPNLEKRVYISQVAILCY